MRKFLLNALLVCLVAVGLAQTLVIKGSNTIFPIAQLWIEEFKKLRPEVKITLEGAGSSTGIAALFNRTTDIANSSRWLKKEEIQKMNQEGKYFIPFLVAFDGIAVIVNKSLPIDEISIETLKKIYTGEITYWSQVNPNLPRQQIVVYSRNTASGTYEVFETKVLKGARMAPHVRMVESSQVEIESVAKNPYAIAYTGVGYVTESVKVLKVDGVYPTKENILRGRYPLARPLFMFVDGTNGFPEPGSLIYDFIMFAFSKRGQELVERAGYIAAYGQ